MKYRIRYLAPRRPEKTDKGQHNSCRQGNERRYKLNMFHHPQLLDRSTEGAFLTLIFFSAAGGGAGRFIASFLVWKL